MLVSLATFGILILLLVAEILNYSTAKRVEILEVDTNMNKKLQINFNFTFYALNCKGNQSIYNKRRILI